MIVTRKEEMPMNRGKFIGMYEYEKEICRGFVPFCNYQYTPGLCSKNAYPVKFL
jgi:hypothetical protein